MLHPSSLTLHSSHVEILCAFLLSTVHCFILDSAKQKDEWHEIGLEAMGDTINDMEEELFVVMFEK